MKCGITGNLSRQPSALLEAYRRDCLPLIKSGMLSFSLRKTHRYTAAFSSGGPKIDPALSIGPTEAIATPRISESRFIMLNRKAVPEEEEWIIVRRHTCSVVVRQALELAGPSLKRIFQGRADGRLVIDEATAASRFNRAPSIPSLATILYS